MKAADLVIIGNGMACHKLLAELVQQPGRPAPPQPHERRRQGRCVNTLCLVRRLSLQGMQTPSARAFSAAKVRGLG